MGWQEMYAHQQQAEQLRALERAAAAQSGEPLRKLTWMERWGLGVSDTNNQSQSVAPREMGRGWKKGRKGCQHSDLSVSVDGPKTTRTCSACGDVVGVSFSPS